MADEVDGLVSDGSWERGFFLGLVGLFVWLLEGRGGFGAWAARYHGLFVWVWLEWVGGSVDGTMCLVSCVGPFVFGQSVRYSMVPLGWCWSGREERSSMERWSGGAMPLFFGGMCVLIKER